MNSRVDRQAKPQTGDALARLMAFGVITAAVVLLVSALLVGPSRAQTAPSGVDSVLTDMARAYADVKSLEAPFVQTNSGMSYGSPMIQKGHLAIERPAKMHWDFTEPTRQQYISDGSTFWWVDHSAKTTTVYRQMENALQQFFRLLTGMDSVKDDFDVSLESGDKALPGFRSLKLVPHSDSGGVGTLFVHVSEKTGLVGAVTNMTAFGDTTLLELGEVTLNKKRPEEHFRWATAEGFRLIEGG